jgi:diguanylate cyclase (GGDEF)-like protein/PAS domain S-box-containing protein
MDRMEAVSPEEAQQAARFHIELLAAAGLAVIAVDTDRQVIYWNKGAEQLYGWSSEEAVGRRVRELLPHEETAEQVAATYAALREGRSASIDYVTCRRDGSAVSVYGTNTPVFDREHRFVGVIGSSVDVTERRAGEEARRQLSLIVNSAAEAIISTDEDGVVLTWNGAAQRLLGYTAAEIVGQPSALFAGTGGASQQAAMRARLAAGEESIRVETNRRHKDGTRLEVLVTMSNARDDDGRVVGLSVILQDIGERLAAQRALEASRRGMAEAQRIGRLGSFEVDIASGAMSWSENFVRMIGLAPDSAPSHELFASVVHPDDLATVQRTWAAAIVDGQLFDVELRIVRPDGDELCVRSRGVPEVALDGTVVSVTGTLTDETERVLADRVRRTAETRFEIGFEQSAIGAVISDLDGLPIRVNAVACAILGERAERLVGRRWTDYTHPDEVPLGRTVLDRVEAGADTFEGERRYIRPDGSVVWTLSHVTLVRDDDVGLPQYFFMQLQDITTRKTMELDLAHQALHDSLTGLANRALLTERLVHGLDTSRQQGTQLGVIFVDIDHFKFVNDSLGHGPGDDLLRQVANRIRSTIRTTDTLARFGGDEFVVICTDVDRRHTEQIAERILVAMSTPWLVDRHDLHVTASVGIAFSGDSSTPESLLRDSDAAMYRAKDRGRGRIEVFDDSLRGKAEERFAMTTALHRALERDELRVHYQPVIDLSDGKLVGVEALIRWQHPERGLISPAEFIPLAGETGLIVPMGAWVLGQACRQLIEWRQFATSEATDLSIAVNLSVRQLLAPDIVDIVDDVLRATGVRPADVCLELTETVLMKDVEYFGTTLARLKALGVSLAIDDFGTGYSSLSYLTQFPVDSLKIDRSFVSLLGDDPQDNAVIAAIVALAGALDLSVIAEGIETRQQLAILKRMGVNRAQGYYLSRPVPAGDISRHLADEHRWTVC